MKILIKLLTIVLIFVGGISLTNELIDFIPTTLHTSIFIKRSMILFVWIFAIQKIVGLCGSALLLLDVLFSFIEVFTTPFNNPAKNPEERIGK